MPSGLIKASLSDHLINSLIPATVALHLSADSRQLGLLALFAWVVLQLLNRIRTLVREGATQETWLIWALLLGLFLFNVRNIVLRDDYRGPILILLIGTGLLLGSQFCPRQWRNLLAWLAVGIVPIALFFVIQLSLDGAWSIPANAYVCPEHLNASAMFCTYYKLVQPSMGSINRLATLLTFLTLAAWYSSTLARLCWSRAAHLVLAATGYWIILRIDSRMAVLAVPFAIILSWLGLRLRQRFSLKAWMLSLLVVVTALGAAAWEVILKSEVLSNTERLRLASCWIRKGMFRSAERFWMGSGYDTRSIGEACESIRPGDPFGHAHNTFAQIAGNHGVLGLIGLIAFTALIMRGLWGQLQLHQYRLDWWPWSSTNWAETSLGLNLALLFCALSTTVQEFSPVNQVLVGLIAGSACVALPPEIRPGMPENRNP